jgi:ribonucleoside-diphosphate reductase alpha chain
MAKDEKQLRLRLTMPPPEPKRVRLPDERGSITHKFTIVGGDVRYNEVVLPGKDGEPDRILYEKEAVDLDGYLTVGVYPDGRPGEIFLTVGRAGDVWKAYDASMIAISLGLQYGIPLETFIDKLEFTQFEPRGITKNEQIPIAKSIPDYLARWLRMKFPKREVEDGSSGRGEGAESPAPEEGGSTPVSVREGREGDQGEAPAATGGHVPGE